MGRDRLGTTTARVPGVAEIVLFVRIAGHLWVTRDVALEHRQPVAPGLSVQRDRMQAPRGHIAQRHDRRLGLGLGRREWEALTGMRSWSERPGARPNRILRGSSRNERQWVREERGERAAYVGGAEDEGQIPRAGLREPIPVHPELVAPGDLERQRGIQELDLRNQGSISTCMDVIYKWTSGYTTACYAMFIKLELHPGWEEYPQDLPFHRNENNFK